VAQADLGNLAEEAVVSKVRAVLMKVADVAPTVSMLTRERAALRCLQRHQALLRR
jgi:hypothetical protein